MRFRLSRFAPLGVFLSGLVLGVALSAGWVASRLHRFVEEGPGSFARTGSEVVMRRLDLDDAQREELRPVFERVESAFAAMHREDLARVRVLLEEAAAEIRPSLRADQAARMDEMLEGPRRRWEKFLGAPAAAAERAPAAGPGS